MINGVHVGSGLGGSSSRRLLQDGAIARTVSEDGTAVSLENNPVILASEEEATNDVIVRASLSNVADTSVEAANGGVARFRPFPNSRGIFDNTRPFLNFVLQLLQGPAADAPIPPP
ncbi:hypothetical protein BSKO_10445 [Bryopsis sp. KO-2023]|nr:hypothetical protein BSKO_10445 [Bryopsis sp. KO-2023]